MALTIGELVATIDADPDGMIRGLTVAELEMAGFRRDAEGQLRRVDGSLVSTSIAAREMGRAFADSADRATLATHGLRRNAAGDLTNVLGGTRGVDDAFERMGQQMLLTSDLGGRSMRRLADDADRGLGERGVSGRSRLASRALSVLRGSLTGVGSGAVGLVGKMAPLLAQLGSAVPLVAGLVGTLESIVPAGAVAVTGILAVVTATSALKIGMSGVGDAVKAAFNPKTTPAALKAALDGLAPPARAFVLTLQSMKPQFDALKLNVQSALFAGLATTVQHLSATVLPVLRGSLTTTTGSLNTMALGVAGAADNLAANGTLGRALKGATGGLSNLAGVPGMVVTALGQLAAAGAPLFGRLTAAAGDAASGISARLNSAFQSGALSQAIDIAVGVLKQLGVVVGNVGSIIGSVFSAAGAAGGSWLGILADITGAMKTAFASPGVQAALGALFSTMRVLGETLGPLVAQALAVIGPVLVALGPPVQTLVKALGAALQPVIKALGPVLVVAAESVGALLDALSPLLPIIGDLIAALLPILTPVLKALGTIFGKLAGPIKQIATALGTALQPVIKGLATVIDDLVSQYLDMFMSILGQLLPLVPRLTPVLIQLGLSLEQILAAVAPLLPQIMMLSATMITQLLPAILPLLPPLLQLTTMLIELATGAITKVVIPTLSFLIKFLGGLQKAFQPAVDAVKWLTTGIAHLFEWLSDHLVGHSVIPDMVRSIVRWFAGLPGKALAALGNIASRLGGVISQAASAMVGQAKYGVQLAAWWIGTLPGKAVGALGNLSGTLYHAGATLLKGFIRGIKDMIPGLSDLLGGITSMIPIKKGPPERDRVLLRPAGRLIMGGLIAGIGDQVPFLQRQLEALTGGLPGMALGAGALGGGVGLAGASAGGPGAGGPVTLRIEVAGPDEVKRLIRTIVKRDGRGGGNSVQTVFG